MIREHDNNEWNLTDLQQAIKKEVRVFEAEVMAGHSPHGSHPHCSRLCWYMQGKLTKVQDDLVYHLNALLFSAKDAALLWIARD